MIIDLENVTIPITNVNKIFYVNVISSLVFVSVHLNNQACNYFLLRSNTLPTELWEIFTNAVNVNEGGLWIYYGPYILK